jgi:superfamily I DNA/RNA helicase
MDTLLRAAAERTDLAGAEPIPLLPRLAALARAGLELPHQSRVPSDRPNRRAGGEVDRRDADEQLPIETADLLAALVGWAAPYRSLPELAAAVDHHRARVAELRRDDAPLTLATAHSTKGLEFDHVAVIGLDAGRFPSARSLREAAEPERALEEERRLAYVAWTRAHRSLTLVYDPASPSQFLLEAFDTGELGLDVPGR